MVQTITPSDEAKQAVSQMEGKDCEINYSNSSDSGRHNFRYSGGAVHANNLDDGWKIVGFGSKWFAIRQE